MGGARALLLLIVPFATALNAMVLGPLLPFVTADLGTTTTIEGALIATAGGTYVCGALLFGRIAQRFGGRRTLIVSLLLFCVVLSGHRFARSTGLLFVARALAGGLAAQVHLGLQVAVPRLDAKLGRAMGLWNVGVFLCMPLGIPAALFLARWEWRNGFVLVGAIASIGLLALALTRWEDEVQPKEARGPQEMIVVISTALYSGALFAFLQFMGKWLDSDGILPAVQQNPIWLGLSVLAAVSSAWVSRSGDRLGLERIALAATGVILFLFTAGFFVKTLEAVVLLGVPLALAVGAQASAVDALVLGFASPARRPELIGVRSAAGALAGAIAAGAGGALFDAWGFRGLLGLLVLMVGLSLSFLPRWIRRPKLSA